MSSLEELKASGECSEWLTLEGLATLQDGYLINNETPKDMYLRVAKSAAKYLNRPELESKFFDYIWKGWLCLSTPVSSNSGSSRGLPISCFGAYCGDSVQDIFSLYTETALLSKYGGGTSACFNGLRERGTPISGGGVSDGIIPWLKNLEMVLHSVSQGGLRRGAGAQYLSIRSKDINEFIDLRKANGADINRRCTTSSLHHAVCIDDEFMESVIASPGPERTLWEKLITTRVEKGEPYIFFTDTVQKADPAWYKDKGLSTKASNLCSEIMLHSDTEHTFVCCLSSLNLAKYDEWKTTDLVQIATWFLDAIITEFIEKASKIPGLEKAVRSAEKGRPLGLGVIGWHTLLQSKMIPFESYKAMQLNNEIWKLIDEESFKASQDLAVLYGEPEWCRGWGIRNTHRLACAPTTSNALISGGVSQGIEPIINNFYAHPTAKGTFIRRNPILHELIKTKGKDNFETWQKINDNEGSVAKLDFLSDEEKAVFSTAQEISQMSIINQAAQRQVYIDQGQSLNIFVPKLVEPTEVEKRKLTKLVNRIHVEAWKKKIKALYYLRSTAVKTGDSAFKEDLDECKTCQG